MIYYTLFKYFRYFEFCVGGGGDKVGWILWGRGGVEVRERRELLIFLIIDCLSEVSLDRLVFLYLLKVFKKLSRMWG